MRKSRKNGSTHISFPIKNTALTAAVLATLVTPLAHAVDTKNVTDWSSLQQGLKDTETPNVEYQVDADIMIDGATGAPVTLGSSEVVLNGMTHSIVFSNSEVAEFITVKKDRKSFTLKNIGQISLDENGRAISALGGIVPKSETENSQIRWGSVVSLGAALRVEGVAIQNHKTISTAGIRFEGQPDSAGFPENGHVVIDRSVISGNESSAGHPNAVWINCAKDLTINASTISHNAGDSNSYAVLSLLTARTEITNSAIDHNRGDAAFIVTTNPPLSPIGISPYHFVPETSVTIKGSRFEGNENVDTANFYRYGGAGLIFVDDYAGADANLRLTMERTLVKDNRSTSWGAGFMVYGEANNVISISDSRFEGNVTPSYGGGLMIYASSSLDATITDTDFVGNGSSLGKAVTAVAGSGALSFIANTRDMRLSETENDRQDIGESYQVVMQGRATLAMKAKKDRTLTVTGGIAKLDSSQAFFDINETDYDGTVNLYGNVETFETRLKGGTLGLLGSATTFKASPLTLMADAGLNTENHRLQALEMKSLTFGAEDVTWLWRADVDLAAATMDSFASVNTVSGKGCIMVDHWNVLTDGTVDRIVVDASEVVALESSFGLTDNGKRAIWTDANDPTKKSYWNVRYLGHEEKVGAETEMVQGGEYEFVRTDPFDIDPNENTLFPGHFSSMLTQVGTVLNAQSVADQVLNIVKTERNWWVTAEVRQADFDAKGLPETQWQNLQTVMGFNSDPKFSDDASEATLGFFVGISHPELKLKGKTLKTTQNSVFAGVRGQYISSDWTTVGFIAAGYADTKLKYSVASEHNQDEELPWFNVGVNLTKVWQEVQGLECIYAGLSSDIVHTQSVAFDSAGTGKSQSNDMTVWRIKPRVGAVKAVDAHWLVSGEVAYSWQNGDSDAVAFTEDNRDIQMPDWGEMKYADISVAVRYDNGPTVMGLDLTRSEGDAQGWTGRFVWRHDF